MVHIVASAASSEVEVFTNQPEAELQLNGRSLGKGLRWNVEWKAGENVLVARAGAVTDESKVVTGIASQAARKRPGALFINEGWIYGTPAAHGRHAVFGSYDGNVYAVDAGGRELWRYATGGEVFASPSISSGSIYVQSSKAVHALDSMGKLKWRVDGLRAMDRNAKSLPFDGDTLYATSDTGQLVAIGMDGRVRWKFEVKALCLTAPVLANGRVVFAADDGITYVVNRDGKLAWKKDSGLRDDAAGPPPNAFQPAANARMIVSGAGHLRAWDHEGNLLWEDRTVRGPVRLVGDRIAITMRDDLQLFDAMGRQLWRFSLNDRRDFFSVPPVLLRWNRRDILAAGTRGTKLVVLDTDGRLLHEFATEDEVSGAATVADLDANGNEELIFGSRDGVLYRIEGKQ
jgi:outer membrane protein assembly factor BamB